jgi:YVTN family beta-propeller protein
LRKLLVIVVLSPIAVAIGWLYFHERQLSDYGPAYHEYAYITNGKSNTVSVIDLRTFELAKTIKVGSEPTGVAANSKKNEIYVVNAGSSNISVIDAERNAVAATIGVHGRPFFILFLLTFLRMGNAGTSRTLARRMFRLLISASEL